MTIVLMKTKAELAFAEQMYPDRDFGPYAATAKSFKVSGLPNRKLEAWKYTDLRALITEALPPAKGKNVDDAELRALLGPLADFDATVMLFVNGRFARIVGKDARGLQAEGVLAGYLSGARERQWTPSGGGADDPQLNLALALAWEGAIVVVRKEAAIELPLHLVFLSTSPEPASTALRNNILIGDGAEVTILETHIGLRDAQRQEHAVTRLELKDGAKVQHLQLVGNAAETTHLGTCVVELGADAQYSAFQMSESPALARNQIFLTFKGEGASFHFNAAMLGRGKSHIDTTMVIDHAVPKCTSRELVKAVLADESHGVFQGKVIVRPDAQKSDGKQSARALLLSPTAEFDSKPELEIYADDVICGHGSTAAELDDDQVFYLRARGIPEHQARGLLIEAFAAEAIEAIAHDGIREAMRARLQSWLAEAKQ